MLKISQKMNKTPQKSFPVMSGKVRAFSLVEVLVVILVIGLLFMFFVPRIDFAGDKARETGVKSDFRSYMLATEQLMREYSGLSKHSNLKSAAQGLNLYLDPDLKIYYENNKDVDGIAKTGVTAGNSVKDDPWNSPYKMEMTAGTGNNGSITITCGGKDGDISTANDNFTITTTYTDGVVKTVTTGFSSNIQ